MYIYIYIQKGLPWWPFVRVVRLYFSSSGWPFGCLAFVNFICELIWRMPFCTNVHEIGDQWVVFSDV